jgi:ABC-type multidrug transport system fused ATPase/permease subunit
MMLTLILSGPIALLLTGKKVHQLTEAISLKIIRRSVMAIVNFFGIIISIFFISAPIPLLLKVIALASLLLNLFTIDREYGGRAIAYLKSYLKRDSNGPVGQS